MPIGDLTGFGLVLVSLSWPSESRSWVRSLLLLYNYYYYAFVVGGLGFEICMFVAGWRHALRSEWPFIIIIINYYYYVPVLIIKYIILYYYVLKPGPRLCNATCVLLPAVPATLSYCPHPNSSTLDGYPLSKLVNNSIVMKVR